MAYRTLEIAQLSAHKLKDVRLFGRMKVYVVVSLSDDPQPKKRTPTDRVGRENPSWNSMTFQFNVPDDNPGRLTLRFLLRTERSLGDRDVGEVNVPVKDLLRTGNGQMQSVSFQVYVPSYGENQGVLKFSYKLGKRIAPPPTIPTTVVQETMVRTIAGYPYPTPANGYGYEAAPPPRKK
ncbi:protein SRC2 homolog [Phoenix dactylifera]|uniref:Protein SRC2 homolog n=1 Tax=Phoenix dactylifera TaxID=42345 RepID=A0A8B7D1F2_PHODC|nr:protein SRC2 homolog [Phoenix dactylifera]